MATLATSLLLGMGSLLDGRVLAVLFKSFAVSVVAFAVVAGAGWFALDWLLAAGGLEDARFAGADSLRGALSLVLAIAGLWLAWRIVAMAVIQFFADEVVAAVERRSYPEQASAARELPLARQARHALGGAGRALLFNLIALPFALALLVTGVGTFLLFWLVNALLLGRELQDMVWLRHRSEETQKAPLGKAERFLLGGAVAVLLTIPFVNFLAPVIGAASATHLIHRRARPSV